MIVESLESRQLLTVPLVSFQLVQDAEERPGGNVGRIRATRSTSAGDLYVEYLVSRSTPNLTAADFDTSTIPLANGNFTFPAGSTTYDFDFDAADDQIPEGDGSLEAPGTPEDDEQFTISLNTREELTYGPGSPPYATLTVLDGNEPPAADDASFSIPEDAALNTVVGNVSATDTDATDTHTFAITGGNTGNAFSIDSNTGAIKVAAALDHETTPSYALTISVTDSAGATDTATVSIAVTNVNEPPRSVLVSSNPASITEGTSVNLTISFSDPEVGDTHEIDIEWGDGETSYCLPVTGPFSHVFKDDDPTASASNDYAVNVTVRDNGGLSGSNTTTVTVNNVAPGSVVPTLSDTQINEGDTVELDISFADPGIRDTFTVTINWGDGSQPNVVTLAAGVVNVYGLSHRYFDDDPDDSIAPDASDILQISVNVVDDDGGGAVTATVAVQVDNLAPMIADVAITPSDLTLPDGSVLDAGQLNVGEGFRIEGTIDDVGVTDLQSLLLKVDADFDGAYSVAEVVSVTPTRQAGSQNLWDFYYDVPALPMSGPSLDETDDLHYQIVAVDDDGSPFTYSGEIDLHKPRVILTGYTTTAREENARNNKGKFTLTRFGPTTDSLTVTIVTSGTATYGGNADYTSSQIPSPLQFNTPIPTTTSWTIPPGRGAIEVDVRAITDDILESTETVKVDLVASPNYYFRANDSTATVNILNWGPIVSVATTNSGEATPNAPASFVISRTGPTTNALQVDYVLQGGLVRGSDYLATVSPAGTIAIPAGAASTTVNLQVVDDNVIEGSEGLQFFVNETNRYLIGLVSSGVTIADNDVLAEPWELVSGYSDSALAAAWEVRYGAWRWESQVDPLTFAYSGRWVRDVLQTAWEIVPQPPVTAGPLAVGASGNFAYSVNLNAAEPDVSWNVQLGGGYGSVGLSGKIPTASTILVNTGGTIGVSMEVGWEYRGQALRRIARKWVERGAPVASQMISLPEPPGGEAGSAAPGVSSSGQEELITQVAARVTRRPAATVP